MTTTKNYFSVVICIEGLWSYDKATPHKSLLRIGFRSRFHLLNWNGNTLLNEECAVLRITATGLVPLMYSQILESFHSILLLFISHRIFPDKNIFGVIY